MRAPDSHIRNFSIIAHIDHGKSTLADRILEVTGAVDGRKHRPQLLDSMELERERGITIKAQAVRVEYTAADGETYRLHLIDTPGHVDFTYEVSRSLAACDGALLLVDASQGVEAQTVANTYLAVDAGLELIPAMNKVDLPGAEPERVAGEIAELLGEDPEAVRRISAKTGEGVEELLEQIVARVPPPQGDADAAPRALIFDSEFDQYRGVVAFVRVVDGEFAKGDVIEAMQTGTIADIDDIGFFGPEMTPVKTLRAGEVGYLITGIKDVSQLRVGDTLTRRGGGATEPLPGYREVKPMVFCGLFPVESDQYPELRDALEKLELNDAALSWEPETSQALGFGFRCGFLGLLHMDIVRERLEREYDLSLLATTPNVSYEVTLTDATVVEVHSPVDMPDRARIEEIREPYIRATILVPKEYVGAIMELAQDRRGEFDHMEYLSESRVQLVYSLPLAEIVL
ncbi:MAG: GTP-binding protein LepA, partial [Thermoleophilaceae bacterium]|nr:GTP-binding protein LepA [Thermoleophilaceae bacterium]